MTHPFAVIGFSYLTVLMFIVTCGGEPSPYVLGVLVILFVVSLFFKGLRQVKVIPTVMAVAIVAFSVYSIRYVKTVKPIVSLNDRDLNMSGVICDVPYKLNNRFYYILKTNLSNVDVRCDNVKIRVSTSTPLDVDVFDMVECNVHTFIPEEKGLFSQRTYMMSKGIQLTGYINEHDEDLVVLKNQDNFTPQKWLLKIRMTVSESIRKLLPNELSSVANGMLLGDKYAMDESVKDNFRKLGISHLLAVSGLHISVITKTLQFIFLFLGCRRNVGSMLSCLGVFLFMAITGFSPSVTRSGIMSIIFLLGDSIGRKADSINSLGFAIFFILIVNPFAAGDLGLWLSFLATLGIILFESKIKSKILLPGFIASTVSVTLSATVLTLPLMIISFGKISLISIVSNFLILVPSMIMIPCILIASAFSFLGVFNFVSYVFAFIAGVLIKYVISCADVLANVPFASVNVSQPHVILWLSLTLLFFGIAIFLQPQKGIRWFKIPAILSVNMLLVTIISNQIVRNGIVSLSVVDTGKGCSIVLNKDAHAAVLSCGGSKNKSSKLLNYIESRDVSSIDYMIIPNYSDLTCSYADVLMEKYKPNTLLVLDDNRRESKVNEYLFPINNTYMFKNEIDTSLWGNVKIKVISSKNKSFIRLDVNDIGVLICPSGGDMDDVPSELRCCDFFIMGKDPKNLDKTKFLYSVVASDMDGAEAVLPKILKNNGAPFITAGTGNVVIDFIKGNKVSIKRGI